MYFLVLLIIGTAAGFLATRLLRMETDILTTIAIGVGGTLVGWLLWRLIVMMAGWLGFFIPALAGSLLLVWLWQRYIR